MKVISYQYAFNGVLENDSKKFEKENYFLLANAHVLQLKNDIEIEKKRIRWNRNNS